METSSYMLKFTKDKTSSQFKKKKEEVVNFELGTK